MADNSFYYDGSLCTACRGCQVACKQWNGLAAEKTEFFAAPGGYQNPAALSPTTWTLMKFHEVEGGPHGIQWLFRRQHCMHCTDAKCIAVCPVAPLEEGGPKAMFRTEYGTVQVDPERCIGCGACAAACPYGVPHVDPEARKSRKCTGCVDRVAKGKQPACVNTCVTDALDYGPRDEMVKKAEARVAALKAAGCEHATLYGLTEQGGLHSLYVLPGAIEVYGIAVASVDLDAIRREADRAWAAWRLERDLPVQTASGAGLAAAAVGGLILGGLKRFAERKAEIAREK
ncbi:MAG: 4Fe-4S dicluster domain-containing protein [Pseudomonadota bacterium]